MQRKYKMTNQDLFNQLIDDVNYHITKYKLPYNLQVDYIHKTIYLAHKVTGNKITKLPNLQHLQNLHC